MKSNLIDDIEVNICSMIDVCRKQHAVKRFSIFMRKTRRRLSSEHLYASEPTDVICFAICIGLSEKTYTDYVNIM